MNDDSSALTLALGDYFDINYHQSILEIASKSNKVESNHLCKAMEQVTGNLQKLEDLAGSLKGFNFDFKK